MSSVVLSSKTLCHNQTEKANYCYLIISIYAQEMTNKSRLGAAKCLILFVCQKHSSYIVFIVQAFRIIIFCLVFYEKGSIYVLYNSYLQKNI